MWINLNEKNKSPRVEIVRVGNFKRRFEDDLKITKIDLEKMKQNFDENARRLEDEGRPILPFNFSHDRWDKASGWIVGLEIDTDLKNFDALFATVEWTKNGAKKIREKEFKFVSSEFTYDFKDPETGKIFDIVLGGAALTNIPFIRDMEAVQLSENKNGSRTVVSLSLELSGDNPDPKPNKQENMNFKELLEELKNVSPEDKIKLAEAVEAENKKFSGELKKSKKDLKKSQDDFKLSEESLTSLKRKMENSSDSGNALKLAEGQIDDLTKQMSSLIKTMATDKKAGEFNQMLSEAKVCEAQRESFMKGNMSDFAKNSQKVKLSESGDNDKGVTDENSAVAKIIKLAEVKEKEDKMKYAEAMKCVLSENPVLAAKAGY